jgi:hypothetical protein
LMVSCFTFISPVSSSMVAPALTSLAKDLHITDAVESQLTLSVFVLAYAVGPLFLGPLSEIYGRVIILQLANLFYLVFNIGCGVSQTKTQMIVCRFFAGLGGSAPLAVCTLLSCNERNLTWLGRWRGLIRLLQTRRARQEYSNLQSRPPPRPSRRPYSWRLHRRKHNLALGLLRNLDRRRRHPNRRPLPVKGDLCPQNPQRTRNETPHRIQRPLLPNRIRTPQQTPLAGPPHSPNPPFPPPSHTTNRPSHRPLPRLHLRHHVPRPLDLSNPLDRRELLQ